MSLRWLETNNSELDTLLKFSCKQALTEVNNQITLGNWGSCEAISRAFIENLYNYHFAQFPRLLMLQSNQPRRNLLGKPYFKQDPSKRRHRFWGTHVIAMGQTDQGNWFAMSPGEAYSAEEGLLNAIFLYAQTLPWLFFKINWRVGGRWPHPNEVIAVCDTFQPSKFKPFPTIKKGR